MVRWLRVGAITLGILVIAWVVTMLLQIVFNVVSWLLRAAIAVVIAFIIMYVGYLVLTKLLGTDPLRSKRSRL